MTSDPTFWLIARASGIAAYTLVWLSVLAGLTLSSRPFGRALKPAIVTEVHRTLALTGIIAVFMHIAALVADSTIQVSPLAAVVPGLVDYRSVWTSFGVIAFDLLLMLQISFAVRRFIGVRRWRALHYAAFGTFALAAAHGLLVGSDSGAPAMGVLYIASIASVIGATTFRALGARRIKRAPRVPQVHQPTPA